MTLPSGPRPGGALTHRRWKATPGAIDRTYEGTFNHHIVTSFRKWRVPADAIPELIAVFSSLDGRATTQKVRDYVLGRIHALRRDGFLIVEDK